MSMSISNTQDKGNTCIKDFRLLETKDAEDAYIRKILKSDPHYRFASDLLLKYIKQYVDYRCDIKILIEHLRMDNMNPLKKIAYNQNDFLIAGLKQCLLDFTEKNLKYTIFENYLKTFNEDSFFDQNKNEINHITFSQIMGAIYPFQTDNAFTKECIEKSSDLKKIFVDKVSDYFSIDKDKETLDQNYDNINSLLSTSTYTGGNWFHLWVLTYANNNPNNLVHNNLMNDPDYIRRDNKFILFNDIYDNLNQAYKSVKRVVEPIRIIIKKTFSSNDVKYDQLPEDNKTFALGCNKYTPNPDGFWYKLMKKNKKQIISGPSSSCVLCYQMAFKIAKVLDETPKNKFILLQCILADYYDFFHSISEVLQEYTVDAGFNTILAYKLDYTGGDIQYLNDLEEEINKNHESLGLQGGIQKKRKTKRRHTNNRRKIKHSHRNRIPHIRRTKRSKK